MTLGTKDFMGMSHAQCSMQAADMSYRLEQAEKVIAELEKGLKHVMQYNHKNYRVGGVENWQEYPTGEAHMKAIVEAESALASAKAFKEGT